MQQLHNILPFSQLAEYGVLAIQPGAGHEGDEELRPIGVGTSVGHGEQEG